MVPMPKVGAAQSWLALDSCLAPFSLASARECAANDIVIDGSRICVAQLGLSMGDIAGPTCLAGGRSDAEQAYLDALGGFAASEMDSAQLNFCAALGSPELRAAALYGLACCQVSRKAFAPALEIVQILLAAGVDHPVFSALAGQAAAAMNDTTLTRQYMARAARGARGVPDLRDILRFAQRTLLIQQFGN